MTYRAPALAGAQIVDKINDKVANGEVRRCRGARLRPAAR